jgi:glycosyltransferase involved in cell wall biosynthesis
MKMTEASAPRPHRVLHVLKYYRPAFTGEGVFLERSSAVMQELAPETTHDLLVTHTPAPADAAGSCNTISNVIYLTRGGVAVLQRQLMLAWWFVRHLHRYDAVHFRTHADWYFVSYMLSKLWGRRLVLSATLDDSLPVLVHQYRPSLRRLAARGFRLFDAYVSISPKLLNETRTMAPAERCHLVPCGVTVPEEVPGVRAEIRKQLGIGPDDPVLLFVGGICDRKDPAFLVRAMPRILRDHPTTRLILIGPPLEPQHVAAIEAMTREHRLERHVFMMGELHDPHPYFSAADMLVFASRLEGFGTVVPEAMAHGMPVVVRRLPGVNDEFVLEGKTGFLFDTEDAFVSGVLRLAGDPALRGRMGAAGKALAEDRFGMRGVAATYLRIYGAEHAAATPKETRLGTTASVHDRRFHAPLDLPADMQPLLITTVDAEEAFDWSAPFDAAAQDVSSMAAQHLAHRVFERHGVRPLYFVDHPVATQDAGRSPLQELMRDGLCEVGAQMHPWVTPPFLEDVNEHNSFAGNLPVELELAKARRLTDVLLEAFGEAPRIYRTGRFGAGRRTADILKQLGYLADSSVMPCWPAPGIAGSWVASAKPYWIDRERSLLEIPVSAALVGRLADTAAAALGPRIFSPRAHRTHLAGAMARLGLMERIRLSPEGMTIEEAKRLVRRMIAGGHRVFVLTYHSPSLVPGNTPYVKDAAELARFLGWLDEFFSFFREEVRGRTGSWRDVYEGVAATPTPAVELAAASAS